VQPLDGSEDPLIRELRRFIWTYAEHDDDCPASALQGPAVMDPANCRCGLTARLQEMMAKVADRIVSST
jgi:hypothetical protein